MNVFVGFVILERKAIENAISYIFAVSVCLEIMHAMHLKFTAFALHPLYSLQSWFLNLYISPLNCLIVWVFLMYIIFPIICVLPCHLSYHLCFSCIVILGWTVVEKAIALIEVNSEVFVYLNYLISKVPISVIVALMLDNSK